MYAFTSALVALLPLTAVATPINKRLYACEASSASPEFAWSLSDFVYRGSYTFSTPAHQIDSGTVGFNITNPAADYTASCTAMGLQLEDFFYGDIVYKCTIPEGYGGAMTFTFDESGNQLQINNTWICNDSSNLNAYTATSTVTLTPTCSTSNYQNPDWQEGEIYTSKSVDCSIAGITSIRPVVAPITV